MAGDAGSQPWDRRAGETARANVGKVPGVGAQEAGDVRNVVIDLLEWVSAKREAAG